MEDYSSRLLQWHARRAAASMAVASHRPGAPVGRSAAAMAREACGSGDGGGEPQSWGACWALGYCECTRGVRQRRWRRRAAISSACRALGGCDGARGVRRQRQRLLAEISGACWALGGCDGTRGGRQRRTAASHLVRRMRGGPRWISTRGSSSRSRRPTWRICPPVSGMRSWWRREACACRSTSRRLATGRDGGGPLPGRRSDSGLLIAWIGLVWASLDRVCCAVCEGSRGASASTGLLPARRPVRGAGTHGTSCAQHTRPRVQPCEWIIPFVCDTSVLHRKGCSFPASRMALPCAHIRLACNASYLAVTEQAIIPGLVPDGGGRKPRSEMGESQPQE